MDEKAEILHSWKIQIWSHNAYLCVFLQAKAGRNHQRLETRLVSPLFPEELVTIIKGWLTPFVSH